MKWQPAVFPKVPMYQKDADLLSWVKRCVCLEKIDGTNTRIGIPVGAVSSEDLLIGGRNLMEGEEGYSQAFLGKMLRKQEATCQAMLTLSREWKLPVTLYGETCGGKIQPQGFIYGKRPHFLLFAAKIGTVWLSYSHSIPYHRKGEQFTSTQESGALEPTPSLPRALPSLQQLSERLHLPLVPLVYEGAPEPETLASLLERPSAHSLQQGFQREDVDNTQEGIVIWADPLLLSPAGEPLFAKYKHPKRKEYIPRTHQKSGIPSLDDFVSRTVLPERIHHAIAYLQELGRLQDRPQKDRYQVVQRIRKDISDEVAEYQEQLSVHGKKALKNALEARTLQLLDEMGLFC